MHLNKKRFIFFCIAVSCLFLWGCSNSHGETNEQLSFTDAHMNEQYEFEQYTLPCEELLLKEKEKQIDAMMEVGCVLYAEDQIYYTISCYKPMAQYPSLGVYLVAYDIKNAEARILYQVESEKYFIGINRLFYLNNNLCFVMNGDTWSIMKYDIQTDEVMQLAGGNEKDEISMEASLGMIGEKYLTWYEWLDGGNCVCHIYSLEEEEEILIDMEEVSNSYRYPSGLDTEVVMIKKSSNKAEIEKMDLYEEQNDIYSISSSIAYGYLLPNNKYVYLPEYGANNVYMYDFNTQESISILSENVPGRNCILKVTDGKIAIYDSVEKLFYWVDPVAYQIEAYAVPENSLMECVDGNVWFSYGNKVLVFK